MISPVIFQRVNAKRIAIDAFDIVQVSEHSDHVEITYIQYERPDSFITSDDFEAVLNKITVAKEESEPKRDGDEWKDHE